MIAIRASESTVYVGWRLLGTDPSDIAFNVYRASGSGVAGEAESDRLSWRRRTWSTPRPI